MYRRCTCLLADVQHGGLSIVVFNCMECVLKYLRSVIHMSALRNIIFLASTNAAMVS